MTNRDSVIASLQSFAPLTLAEDWDNVGLLWGSSAGPVTGILTCLTLTPDVAAEAIRDERNLIITHHPILFRPVQRITDETAEGQMLLALARHDVSVYAPHTAFDSTGEGINAELADRLELENVKPLRPSPKAEGDEVATRTPTFGAGRYGTLPSSETFLQFVHRVKYALDLLHVQVVLPTATNDLNCLSNADAEVRTIGLACGAASEFLADANRLGCDVFVTGETRFHTALEARAQGIGMVLVGHYASERFALESLARRLEHQFPGVPVSASAMEADPLTFA